MSVKRYEFRKKTQRTSFLQTAQLYNTPTPHQPATEICAINTSANENLPPEAAAYISLRNSALSRPSLNLTLHYWQGQGLE